MILHAITFFFFLQMQHPTLKFSTFFYWENEYNIVTLLQQKLIIADITLFKTDIYTLTH